MGKHKDKHDPPQMGTVDGLTRPARLDKQFKEGQFLAVKFKNAPSEGFSNRLESIVVTGNVDYVTEHVVGLLTYEKRRYTFSDTDIYTKDVEVLERG